MVLAGGRPLPAAAAASSWQQPATLTCAGVSGIMADGAWTHYGAAAIWPGLLAQYPFGTVLQLADDSLWTVEDTTAWWVGGYWQDGLHLDLYNGLYGGDCWRFGVEPTAFQVRRLGWYGDWR
jgi:hypothetical protein